MSEHTYCPRAENKSKLEISHGFLEWMKNRPNCGHTDFCGTVVISSYTTSGYSLGTHDTY